MTGAPPAPVAQVSMNDWPEVRGAWDGLWAGVRDGLRARGLAAPEALDRTRPAREVWDDPGLALALTCGLPFVRGETGRARMVGAPDFAVPGCAPGEYRSALVVRADEPRAALAAFRGARLAVNGPDSQSGAQAMMQALAEAGETGRFFGAVLRTGAHEASAAAVAEGRADIAAIDWTTWRLIRAHRPCAPLLRVLGRTAPVPSLPFVTALDPSAVRAAVAEAVAAAPEAVRAPLHLAGFVPREASDYAVLAERRARARAVSAAHGL
jgi:ABC-type phosphate/phosphonate transport system substrate-binding protein